VHPWRVRQERPPKKKRALGAPKKNLKGTAAKCPCIKVEAKSPSHRKNRRELGKIEKSSHVIKVKNKTNGSKGEGGRAPPTIKTLKEGKKRSLRVAEGGWGRKKKGHLRRKKSGARSWKKISEGKKKPKDL